MKGPENEVEPEFDGNFKVEARPRGMCAWRWSGPMQRWTSEIRQVRKEAAVVGFTCAVGCLATFLSGHKVMPRDWNQAYLTGDTPWDKGRAGPPLAEFLAHRSMGGKVLVPGCGAGHDVRLLAAQGADVTGLDVAPAGVKRAEEYPAAGGERYVCGDLLDLGPSYDSVFDWVFEHTCLCALCPDEREAYAAAVTKVLKPGGQLLGIFYLGISDFDRDGPPHPIETKALDELFGKDFDLLESYTPKLAYPSRPIGSEEVRLMRRRASDSVPTVGSCGY